jgi:hypothetical protein
LDWLHKLEAMMKISAKSVVLGMSLVIAPISAFAQSSGTPSDMPSGRQGTMPMYRQMQGMMGGQPRMPDYGTHGQGMMGVPMRVMMILMDTNGDGALSLEEVQAAHARVFKAIDADKTGTVTHEEMQAFMYGAEQANR